MRRHKKTHRPSGSRKGYDIITFGSATRDVYMQSAHFRGVRDTRSITRKAIHLALGTKLDIPHILFETGGGGTNTAASFARLGFKTAVVTQIGKDDARGREIVRTLKHEGVDTRFIRESRSGGTAYSMLLQNPKGERTILVYRGVSAKFSDRTIPWRRVRNTKWFYITTLGGNIPLLKKLVRFANRNKIHVALNPGRTEIAAGYRKLKPILAGCTVVLLNREEASQLTGMRYERVNAMFKKLCFGLPGVVVITEGRRGALVADNDYQYVAKTHTIRVKDTTGAGDSFGAGFVAGYLRTKGDVAYALQFGIENAESVLQQVGAKNGLRRTFTRRRPRAVKKIIFPNQ